MELQPRDIKTLLALATYAVLDAVQIRNLAYPTDRDRRITRRRLSKMRAAGFIRATTLHAPSPITGHPAPAYYLAQKGLEQLTVRFDDPWLFCKSTSLVQPAHLSHYLEMSQFHIKLRAAIERHPTVSLQRFITEHEVIDATVPPEKQKTLYSRVQDRPLIVNNPDGAFLLLQNEHQVVYYVERERSGTGAHQVYKRKTKGYRILKDKKLHCQHFPTTTFTAGFTVLCVAQSPNHRRLLCAAFKGRPAAQIWRFAAAPELTEDSILVEPVWYHADRDEPGPLIRSECG